jgi:hypothetical protein
VSGCTAESRANRFGTEFGFAFWEMEQKDWNKSVVLPMHRRDGIRYHIP